MHTSTSLRRSRIGVLALATALLVGLAFVAFIAGVTPARAADIASQPDMQVVVFMLPLTLLVLILLFEAARFVRRGALPAQSATRPARRLRWSADRAAADAD